MRSFLLLLTLTSSLLAQVNVSVETTTGGTIRGTVAVASLSLAGEYGKVDVPLEEVESIAFGTPDVVRLTDGCVERGTFSLQWLVVESDSGRIEVSHANLRSLAVLLPAEVSAPPPASDDAERARQEEQRRAWAEGVRQEEERRAWADRGRQEDERRARAERERQEDERRAAVERERQEDERRARAERERQEEERRVAEEERRRQEEAKRASIEAGHDKVTGTFTGTFGGDRDGTIGFSVTGTRVEGHIVYGGYDLPLLGTYDPATDRLDATVDHVEPYLDADGKLIQNVTTHVQVIGTHGRGGFQGTFAGSDDYFNSPYSGTWSAQR